MYPKFVKAFLVNVKLPEASTNHHDKSFRKQVASFYLNVNISMEENL